LEQYYRCPGDWLRIEHSGQSSTEKGYFKFGQNVLYGRLKQGETSHNPGHITTDVLSDCRVDNGAVWLSFDPMEAIDNLRYEEYAGESSGDHPASSLIGRAYYLLRPLLPIAMRKHLQKLRLSGWRYRTFPQWPVDDTVDAVLERLLLMCLKAQGLGELPFIWFWPDTAQACAIVTHDVEALKGRDYCATLMDVDDEFGIRASFQVVPESRYEVPDSFLENIRARGFEVNIQDLNHDGHLFRDHNEFLRRVPKINNYGRKFEAKGFRSAILYRRQAWLGALEFAYDMSVPNVAHLDPQHGGCCTVMPYFISNLVELPVTTTQDYSLFNILGEHSIDLWKQQIEFIVERHGLINLIIHPDYVTAPEEMATYKALLRYLRGVSDERELWMPLPREVASWWRDRAGMKLVNKDGEWKIEGIGSERARVAYAREQGGKLVYSFHPQLLTSNRVKMTEPRQC
jgi:hypothetical protein